MKKIIIVALALLIFVGINQTISNNTAAHFDIVVPDEGCFQGLGNIFWNMSKEEVMDIDGAEIQNDDVVFRNVVFLNNKARIQYAFVNDTINGCVVVFDESINNFSEYCDIRDDLIGIFGPPNRWHNYDEDKATNGTDAMDGWEEILYTQDGIEIYPVLHYNSDTKIIKMYITIKRK